VARKRGDVHGVVVVDKPKGITSFDVVAEVRRRMGTARVGHTGTLDPMATGVLPVCLGEATKLVPFITDCDKAYEAEVLFGVGMSTGDAEGEVVATADASTLDPAAVEAAAAKMIGTIQQRPPMYSAIKIDGQRLYDLARKGVEVERATRPIVVHALSMSRIEGPRYTLRIRCGKGTYVRVIAEDLGAALGLPAHLTALRRTAVGAFDLSTATPLAELGSSTPMLGLAAAVAHLPSTILDEAGCKRIRAGQERWLFGLPSPPPEGRSTILDDQQALVAVLSRTGQKILFERVFVDSKPAREANTRST
jgi:tRNA pseudouridine55 synthase